MTESTDPWGVDLPRDEGWKGTVPASIRLTRRDPEQDRLFDLVAFPCHAAIIRSRPRDGKPLCPLLTARQHSRRRTPVEGTDADVRRRIQTEVPVQARGRPCRVGRLVRSQRAPFIMHTFTCPLSIWSLPVRLGGEGGSEVEAVPARGLPARRSGAAA